MIKENFSLKEYNTFSLNVSCKYFLETDNREDIVEFLHTYMFEPGELLILGEGSHVLFTENFQGTVIRPTMSNITVMEESGKYITVRVGAGLKWDDFVLWAVTNGLEGVAGLSGIPGTVGGAVVQNISFSGMGLREILTEVEAIEIEQSRMVSLPASNCELNLGDSIFRQAGKHSYVITGAHFQLKKGNPDRQKNIRLEILEKRKSLYPDIQTHPNGGIFFTHPWLESSVFETLTTKFPGIQVIDKNPDGIKVDVSSLIEISGYSPNTQDKTFLWPANKGIIVSRGAANGIDISILANEVKKKLFFAFGISPEIDLKVV